MDSPVVCKRTVLGERVGLHAYIRPLYEPWLKARALMGIRALGPHLKSGLEGQSCYQGLPAPGPTGLSITRHHRNR